MHRGSVWRYQGKCPTAHSVNLHSQDSKERKEAIWCLSKPVDSGALMSAVQVI